MNLTRNESSRWQQIGESASHASDCAVLAAESDALRKAEEEAKERQERKPASVPEKVPEQISDPRAAVVTGR